jgi:PAS domain S-box-containing protein
VFYGRTCDTGAVELTSDTFAELVGSMGDAVVIADAEGRVTYWNGSAERMFGWPAEEAVGQSLDLIIPERLRQRHWDGYQKVMETGETRYGHDLLRVPAVRRNGERMSIAFTVCLLEGAGGPPGGIAAVIRDESDRWAEEQALRRRVNELERSAQSPSST